MKIPTLSTRSDRLRTVVRVVMWIGIALVVIAIAASVTYAQNVHGSCNGHGCTGSWGDPTWSDYAGAVFMVLAQILVIIIARR